MWGFISDVHGNYVALQRALRVLQAAGAIRLAFLGDYLGRGDSDRCVDCIRSVAEVAILGNRDLDWQDRVSASSRAWVVALPGIAQVGPLLVSHGDARLTPPLSTREIGRDFRGAYRVLEPRAATVWAFGHSHHARLWRKRGADAAAEALSAPEVGIEPGWRYFLNVGTTGLPFPNTGGPSVAVVDFERGQIRQIALERISARLESPHRHGRARLPGPRGHHTG